MSINVLELADQISRHERMTRDAIVKELMHHDLLRALIATPLGKNVVFQGGTALRLCYGNERYSEDLDFARHGHEMLDISSVGIYEATLKKKLEAHYDDMHITIKPPKPDSQYRTEDKQVQVQTWVICAEIDGLRKDEKRPKIKIEIADVPAHSLTSRRLMNHYQNAAFQPMALPINVQTQEEILADKVMAMMGRPRIQYRDVWDLHWLESRRINLNYEFIMRKFRDYHVSDDPKKVQNHLQTMEARIDFLQTAEGVKLFNREMSRFLGGDLRMWLEPNHTTSMIKSVTDNLEFILKDLRKINLEGPLRAPGESSESGYNP
jgi:predicted nucleotidyltransferase component of viral defense system